MASIHVLVVGWDRSVVEKLGRPIASRSRWRFSFVLHPRELSSASAAAVAEPDTHYFFDTADVQMPEPDVRLLQSIEAPDVPTIHNMILGDRVVSKLQYRDALGYATFLAKRIQTLLVELAPSMVIGSFDALHSGIAHAMARQRGIPWFALNFSVIPPGLACFCSGMSPAERVPLRTTERGEARTRAAHALEQFEAKLVRAPAYMTPPPLSLPAAIQRIPARVRSVARMLANSRARAIRKFTDTRGDYSIMAAVRHQWRVRAARHALGGTNTVRTPPATPYVLFGLHMQPESSIDVWAPFFSNQMWVIELLARSVPPTHGVLVKIHKSDAAHYSRAELERMLSFPGVRLVEPFASSREFIEGAELVIVIQGTMGLEAALLGKPVVSLGDSPISVFPSVTHIGQIEDLPRLIRHKLAERAPARSRILEAYEEYLGPFTTASHNDWTAPITSEAIDGYVRLFDSLGEHVSEASDGRAVEAR